MPRVGCRVEGCSHWRVGDRCGAEAIDVLSEEAHIAEDADCTTFEAREPREVPRPAE